MEKSIMKKLFLTLAAIALPLTAHAAVYECDATTQGPDGWIPPKIFLEVNDAGTEAKAYDGLIKSLHGKPISVGVEKKPNGTYEMSWKLRNVKTSNAGSSILSHNLILNPSAGSFKMRGRLHGFDNHISGRGTCKRIK